MEAVTEQEIETAEELAGQGQHATALSLAQTMLCRAQDDETRIRLLFNIVSCSAQLDLNDITKDAVQALERLPDSDSTWVLAGFLTALAHLNLNRPMDALKIIEANLESDVMKRDDFDDSKYEHLVYKGSSLTRLARCVEALDALDAAHTMYPDGKYETDILIDRCNCLSALHRYDEVFEAGRQVLSRDEGDMATLAMQYMAECRMGQGKVQESLALYSKLQKRLPCPLVQEEQIRQGIQNGMDYLERHNAAGKPS